MDVSWWERANRKAHKEVWPCLLSLLPPPEQITKHMAAEQVFRVGEGIR